MSIVKVMLCLIQLMANHAFPVAAAKASEFQLYSSLQNRQTSIPVATLASVVSMIASHKVNRKLLKRLHLPYSDLSVILDTAAAMDLIKLANIELRFQPIRDALKEKMISLEEDWQLRLEDQAIVNERTLVAGDLFLQQFWWLHSLNQYSATKGPVARDFSFAVSRLEQEKFIPHTTRAFYDLLAALSEDENLLSDRERALVVQHLFYAIEQKMSRPQWLPVFAKLNLDRSASLPPLSQDIAQTGSFLAVINRKAKGEPLNHYPLYYPFLDLAYAQAKSCGTEVF